MNDQSMNTQKPSPNRQTKRKRAETKQQNKQGNLTESSTNY